jgi:hemerythrin-like domain-containing protein
MSKPIDLLMEEHRVIEKVLDALESFAKGFVGTTQDRQSADRFATFFRVFADSCHHGKEEDLLFEELMTMGMAADSGPLGVMLEEHELGRSCVSRIAAVAAGDGEWTSEERESFSGAVSEFVPLLRAHIQKEDRVLFPTADGMLSPEKIDALGDQFEQFCRVNIGVDVHKEMLALADSLAKEWPASQD